MKFRESVEQIVRDVRYGARQLRKAPAFSVAAGLTLALGIGANTAMFSVADAVLLRALPYPNADRLVLVWNKLSKIGVSQMPLSAEDYEAFRTNRHVLEASAAFKGQDRNLIAAGVAGRVSTVSTTPGLLEMLGAHTMAGRLLTDDDWKPDHNRVVMISHSLFVRRFSARPTMIGQSIRLDDALYTITGVLADGFEFGPGAHEFDVWMPLPPVQERRKAQFLMLARIRAGMGIAATRAYVAATAERLNETVHPYEGPNGEDGGYGASVVPLRDQLWREFRTGTFILLGAVGLVLLIACVNVANLLLARGMAREKEMALRTALGASRYRLARQLLTEACLLTVIGGLVGVAASLWGVQALRTLLPAELPGIARINVDGRALLFTFALSAGVCILFSAAPALSLLQISGNFRGPRRRGRVTDVLVASEAALALMLLIASGLLLKSFDKLRKIDPGVRTDHVLTMSIELTGPRYEKPRDRIQFFSELRSRMTHLPGVISASETDRLPIFTAGADTRSGNPFSIDGSPFSPNAPTRQIAHTGTVGLDYFRTMGIPLLTGRTFAASDTLDGPRVAVINKTLARNVFPRGALGKRILLGLPEKSARWLKIVGVIGDVRTGALDLPPMPQFYIPVAQDEASHLFVVVRTAADPMTTAHAAADLIRRLDPELAPDDIRTMDAHVDEMVGQPRFRTVLLMLFGTAALFLAAVGIYGVVAHAVSERTKEIGIRMALGASAKKITATVLAWGLQPVIVGIVVGFAGAEVMARFLASILYDVSPSDPWTMGVAGLVLTFVAMMSCVGPALRASHVDPVLALKHE